MSADVGKAHAVAHSATEQVATLSNTGSVVVRALPELRAAIDVVDAQLVALLNERARLVVEVGARKRADGDTPVYAPDREQAVLRKVLALSGGPLLPVTLEAVYRELMSGSFALERQLRIGYLGPPGSFSHEASVRQFGRSVQYENLRSIAGVFEEVARGHVDYGLVPVENALVGSVAETLDGFLAHPGSVAVCAEVHLAVAQALIAPPGAQPADVAVIASKGEALGQCARWLATQYPQARTELAASTSAAVRDLAAAHAADPEAARGRAAIGSRLAAELHGMQVLFPNISDASPNITRFLVLTNARTAAARSAPSGADKTSLLLLFTAPDRAGALRDLLAAFATQDVNLSHIEKRPLSPAAAASVLAATNSGGEAATSTLAASSASQLLTPQPAAGVFPRPPSEEALSAVAASAGVAVPPSLLVPTASGGRGSAAAPFAYAFFVEAEAHVDSPQMVAALAQARAGAVRVLVLGSFPKARRVL